MQSMMLNLYIANKNVLNEWTYFFFGLITTICLNSWGAGVHEPTPGIEILLVLKYCLKFLDLSIVKYEAWCPEMIVDFLFLVKHLFCLSKAWELNLNFRVWFISELAFNFFLIADDSFCSILVPKALFTPWKSIKTFFLEGLTLK